MSATDTVTIGRVEFEEVLLQIGGVRVFVDSFYGRGQLDSVAAANDLWQVVTRLRDAAGLPWLTETDEAAEARWDDEERRAKDLTRRQLERDFPGYFAKRAPEVDDV